MSQFKVVKWEMFCCTENQKVYKILDSSDYIPTTCPNDPEHVIDVNQTSHINNLEENTVKVKEEDITTQGFFRAEGDVFSCPANTTTIKQRNLNYPVGGLAFYINASENNYGDVLNVYISLGVIGVLTTNVLQGETVLPISTPIFDKIPIGFQILINGNVIGEVIGKGNGTLDMDFPFSQNYAAGSMVSLRAETLKNFTIGRNTQYQFGATKIGASYIPKEYSMIVAYTNKSTSIDKEFNYHTEYLY